MAVVLEKYLKIALSTHDGKTIQKDVREVKSLVDATGKNVGGPTGGGTQFSLWMRDWGSAQSAPEVPSIGVRSPLLNLAAPQGQVNVGDYSQFEDLLTKQSGLSFLQRYSIAGVWKQGATGNDEVLDLLEIYRRLRGSPGKYKYQPPAAGLRPNENLKNGVWHHMPTGREFPITDGQYGGNEGDSPIMALGHNLTRVLSVGNRANSWYEENEPPMRPKFPEQQMAQAGNMPQYNTVMQAYVRAMRSWLRKFALEIIENDSWVMFWRGYLFTNGIINFQQIFRQSPMLQKWETEQKVPSTENVIVVDARNHKELSTTTWGQLQKSISVSGTQDAAGSALEQYLRELGKEMKKVNQRVVESEVLPVRLFNAICEMMLLQESLTYNQMLTATAQFWKTRLRNVRQVHTHPPTMVMLKDGTVDLNFHFESRPSTEGKPHNGYVKFIPEIGKVNFLDKVKELLGKAAKNIQRFFNKKVPPQILKGSDLRKMLVEVSCDCKDFKYRMSFANVKAGVTAQRGRTDNGQAPNITNPRQHPGFCKHILATVRYLTDDAEITIEKELSDEQIEALRKDREQFMRDALAAYDRMQAPEAEPEEEEAPPEEEPEAPPEGITRLAPPPKPTEPKQAPAPATPAAPPSPPYQSSQ